MKSFLPYLIFSLLLVICYYEKRYTCLAPKATLEKSFTAPRLFEGKFVSLNESPSFQMHLYISNNFIKGSYRPANSKKDVDLFGAVSSENELILIGSADGKTTGTFKGTLENGSDRLLKLSGIWTNTNGGKLLSFSGSEVR